MLVVMALDGTTLAGRGWSNGATQRRLTVEQAARVVAGVAAEHHVVLTYGRGPQVGLLALQALPCSEVRAYPLEVPGADTEDTAGYLLEQELGRYLPADRLASLITRVVVAPDDAAFAYPSEGGRSRRRAWAGGAWCRRRPRCRSSRCPRFASWSTVASL
jgi:carbamate kinase